MTVHIIAVVCILIAVTKSALLAIVIVFGMYVCIIFLVVVVVVADAAVDAITRCCSLQ